LPCLAFIQRQIRGAEYLHLQLRDIGLGWKAPADQMGAHVHGRHQQTHIGLKAIQRQLLVGCVGGKQRNVASLHGDLVVLGGDDVT